MNAKLAIPELTTERLKTIQPKRGRGTVCIPDGQVGGLSIRVGAKGRIEFSLVYRRRSDPRQIRETLGYWWNDDLGPAPSDRYITLHDARLRAEAIKAKAATG
jgi:hypothetical protein